MQISPAGIGVFSLQLTLENSHGNVAGLVKTRRRRSVEPIKGNGGRMLTATYLTAAMEKAENWALLLRTNMGTLIQEPIT